MSHKEVSATQKKVLEVAFKHFSYALWLVGIKGFQPNFPLTMVVEATDLQSLYQKTKIPKLQLFSAATGEFIAYPSTVDSASYSENARPMNPEQADDPRKLDELNEEESQLEHHLRAYRNHMNELITDWNSKQLIPGMGEVRVTVDEILLPTTRILGNGTKIKKLGGLVPVSFSQLRSEDSISEFFETQKVSRHRWIERTISEVRSHLESLGIKEPPINNIDYAIQCEFDEKKGKYTYSVKLKDREPREIKFASNDENSELLLALMKEVWIARDRHKNDDGKLFIAKDCIEKVLKSKPRNQGVELKPDAARKAVENFNERMMARSGVNKLVLEGEDDEFIVHVPVVERVKRGSGSSWVESIATSSEVDDGDSDE